MISYNELYELLRKEKYSEQLQQLPKNFIEGFKEYLNENRDSVSSEKNLFSESITKSKKQLENAVSIFREIMLKRKRKILNLVFIATETGIMKRDYENLLEIEKQTFEQLVKSFEDCDKKISEILNNKGKKEEKNKMVILKENLEQFVDHTGNTIGPFKSGQLANINSEVASILVQGGKASFVDES